MIDTDNSMTRAECADFVVEQLRSMGLNPHPSSRLMAMQRILHSGFVPYEDADFPAALESIRDLAHLKFVFEQLVSNRNDKVFLKLVRDLISDSIVPQKDLVQSPGRDAQFELYLAAVCQNAGLAPVDHAEPDITCFSAGQKFGIAAKRIKSRDRIAQHIKKAVDQIARSGIPGIIALDPSLAWNRTNAPITSSIQSHWYLMFLDAQARNFFEEYQKDILGWTAGTGVLGVVVFNFRIRMRSEKEWGLDGLTSWLETTGDDQIAKAKFEAFCRPFVPGILGMKGFDPNA